MSNRLPIRFSDRTWNLIDAAATAEGITPASWVRRLVEERLVERRRGSCHTCGCPDRDAFFHEPISQDAPEGLSQPRSASESRRSTSEALLNWASRQDRQTPIQDNINRNSNSYVGDEKMIVPKFKKPL